MQHQKMTSAEYRARQKERSTQEDRLRSPMRVHSMVRAGIRLGILADAPQLVEEQMVTSYGTSRNAVREAMVQLAREGLVTRSPRHGTIVVGHIAQVSMFTGRAEPTPDELFSATQIDSAVLPANPLMRWWLGTEDDAVHMAEWLVRRNGEPFCVYANYGAGPAARRRLTVVDATEGSEGESFGDLAEVFREAYGTELALITASVEAVLCDARMGKLLGVSPGQPLLFRERLLTGANGVPLEYSHTYYLGTRASLLHSISVEVPSPSAHDAPGSAA